MTAQANLATATDRFRGPLAARWGASALPDALEDARGLGSSSVRPATDRAFWAGLDPSALGAIAGRARAELATPWPQPLASHYARYFRDGNRTDYEARVGARQERLTRAVLVAAWTGEQRWVDEVADGVVLLCEQSSWCWAAHDDTFARHGCVTPTLDDPYLDLGAGEVAGQLAWVDHVLGAALDARAPGVRQRMRAETRRRVLEPFATRRDWHWLGLDGDVHNWNPWIHGNVLVAALAFLDSRERADVVALVIAGLDRYLASLPPDGGIDEGYSYWWNGAGRALEAFDLLARATSGELDASAVPVLRETARFPHRMQLGGSWYLNVGDGSARASADQAWHVLHRWGALLGDQDVVGHAASHRAAGGGSAVSERAGLGRALAALADADWRAAAPTAPPLVERVWLPDVQVALVRERGGSCAGLTLAIKGGHNGEHHNHNDVGSVVVAIDGVPVVVDAGKPTYTAQTFGPDRYAIWTMQSSWHNVPEPRGTAQGVGRGFGARSVSVDAGPDRVTTRLDLAGAYDLPELAHWWRDATLDRAAQVVTIAEEWELNREDAAASGGGASNNAASNNGASSNAASNNAASSNDPAPEVAALPTRLHYLLAGAVVATGPHEVTVHPSGGTRGARLCWAPGSASAELTVRPLDDPSLAEVWGDTLTRLELTVAPGPDPLAGTFQLTVQALG
ncbi:heparinase II/III family protein [Pengzhenrongella sp.]|uniref:heparinase II/III family protein n=1 Tax=Pengzhenrongella sp. TaxID=2888820 RepID=UPI002F93B58B